MNVRLLRKIQKHILAEPKRYWQNDWLTLDTLQQKARAGSPPCGTQGCIAGWACVLGQPKVPIKKLETEAAISAAMGMDNLIAKRAEKLLGLNHDQAVRLFNPSDEWPDEFAHAYNYAKTNRGRVRAAIRRIDHFIRTKGAE